MSKLLLIIFLLVTLTFASNLKWHSFNTGLKIANTEKKPMMIDFYTDWCKWCKVMDEKTFNESKVKKYLAKNFVSVKVNPEKDKEQIKFDGKEFAPSQFTQAVGVNGYPAIGFIDKDGKFITVLPGYTEAAPFLEILHYIRGEYYAKKISFEDYKKGKR